MPVYFLKIIPIFAIFVDVQAKRTDPIFHALQHDSTYGTSSATCAFPRVNTAQRVQKPSSLMEKLPFAFGSSSHIRLVFYSKIR